MEVGFKQLDLDYLTSQEFESLLKLKNNELKLRKVNWFLRHSFGFTLGFGFSAAALFGVPVGILVALLLQSINAVPCFLRHKLKKVVEKGQNLVNELSFDIAVLESGVCLSNSFNKEDFQDMREAIINHDRNVVENARKIADIERVAVVDKRSDVSYPIINNGGINVIKDGAINFFPVLPPRGVVNGRAGFVSEVYRISYKDGTRAYFAAMKKYGLRTKKLNNGQLKIGIGAKKPVYLYLGREGEFNFYENVVVAIRKYDASKEQKAEIRRNAFDFLKRFKRDSNKKVRKR